MPSLPSAAQFVIIGAGIHGLSTSMHLAQKLRAKGRTVGAGGVRIVVLEKTGVGAGASGIACGVVRNNYYQPAMRELMAHSVGVWESDAQTYSYHPVGYMQISPEVMHAQVGTIYEQQKAIGYESTFIEGEADSLRYMQGLLHDWQAKNITSVLHEKRGGYANNQASLAGLERKTRALGVDIVTGVAVTSFRSNAASGAVNVVETDAGAIACDQVVVAVGPWINSIWNMLALPKQIVVKGRDGATHEGVRMWHYMALQEGTLGVDPDFQKTNDGAMPPVIHVDTDAPLYSDRDGKLITDRLWGLYYKPDFHFGGVQGGAMPATVERDADQVCVDPYGPKSPEFVVDDHFADMWTSALAHCQKRFEGKHGVYRNEPSGGVGCFTPDSFPVFDRFRENVYVIADSNHGYKMIGVGKLVAEELLGAKPALLEPFRFSRYAAGKLHPVSRSPFSLELMDKLLSRDRWVVLAALAAVAALAWAYLAYIVLAQPVMDMDTIAMAAMPPPVWGAGYFAATLAMWIVMMVGMMLPSATPTVLLFDALQMQGDPARRRRRATALFAAGYVLAWAAFSVLATAAQWALSAASLLSAMMTGKSSVFAASLLVIAGTYQFTPFKTTCLTQCRSPAEFLVRHRRPGPLGPLLMGLQHGVQCIGCCWALMALLFAFGVMNLLWVAALAIFVFIEKLTLAGPLVGRVGGFLMICAGLALMAIG